MHLYRIFSSWEVVNLFFHWLVSKYASNCLSFVVDRFAASIEVQTGKTKVLTTSMTYVVFKSESARIISLLFIFTCCFQYLFIAVFAFNWWSLKNFYYSIVICSVKLWVSREKSYPRGNDLCVSPPILRIPYFSQLRWTIDPLMKCLTVSTNVIIF
jgi:hypothetical protein